LVASAYRTNSSLRNGFARLSGIQSEARNWKEAFRLAIKDHQQGRMSPDWQLNLAQLYGRRGEFERATSLILGAYEADSFLQNGFARLGWIRAETQDWEGALELSARDARLSRISPLWQMHLALLHGRLGEFKSASIMMESAYQADSSLISGFCRLGWIRAEKKDWNGAFELAARDERLARLSPAWQVNLAQLYGHRGEFEHAVTMIQSAYEADSSLKDGFVRLGWIRAEAKDLEGALELSVIDERERRLSPPWQLKLAQLYGHRGDFEHAVSLIHTAYQSDSSLENGFVHLAWIRGNAGDWACALDLARKDEELGRLSPTWAMNLEAIRQYHFSQ
jgi:tetratricopeptide (TPR) repeat protein